MAFGIGALLFNIIYLVIGRYFFDYLANETYFFETLYFYVRWSWGTRPFYLLVPYLFYLSITAGLLTYLGLWKRLGLWQALHWRDFGWYVVPLLITGLRLVPIAGQDLALHLLYQAIVSPFFIAHLLGNGGEELFYRGLVQTAAARYGRHFATAFSAFLFGLMHFSNWGTQSSPLITVIQVFRASAWGYGAAALQAKTRVIWPLIILHALTNTVVEHVDLVVRFSADNPTWWFLQLSPLAQRVIYELPFYMMGLYGVWVLRKR